MNQSRQLIINPVTKQFEMLTLKEWRHLKAGFGINDDQPEHVLDFRIDINFAMTKYCPALKLYKNAHKRFLESIIRKMILDPDSLLAICEAINHYVFLDEIENQVANVYELKRVLHEINKLRPSVPKRNRNRRKRNS